VFEVLGGVPGKVLADRMGCLKGGVVPNVVVPTPDYMRFAAHYGFRPDFCEANDPQSKGIVENLVGYAKTDLMVPQAPFADLVVANEAAAAWCGEVNAAVHSELYAVPAERLVSERELLAPLVTARRGRCARASASSSPARSTALLCPVRLGPLLGADAADGDRDQYRAASRRTHPRALGEVSNLDAHYGGPRPAPRRVVRPKTVAEK